MPSKYFLNSGVDPKPQVRSSRWTKYNENLAILLTIFPLAAPISEAL